MIAGLPPALTRHGMIVPLAAGALILGRPKARFEGQLAMLLEQCATGTANPWPFEIRGGELDLRPMWRALAEGFVLGQPKEHLAARFHAMLGAGTAAMIRQLHARLGRCPVVLSGGCFVNARLVDEVLSRLDGVDSHRNPRPRAVDVRPDAVCVLSV